MPIKCIAPPTVEPLTLAEAKLHLREVVLDEGIDSKIQQAIQGAREIAENDTRRSFLTQQWQIALDSFPRPAMNLSNATWYGPQWGSAPGPLQILNVDGTTGYEIFLPYPPLQRVDEIKYIDQNGATQTMNLLSDIIVDSFSEPARILPAFGTVWPATQIQANAVLIKFTCGYGDTPDVVPAAVKMWMLSMIGAAYEARELEVLLNRGTVQHFPFIDRLLDPVRIRRY
jgi:hypothetical protein